ncbi:hypothetical protein ISS40_02365 [Candidatus Bathyarchaeota archaeon]|nr:hypothetical protein [Candidatus Bathyarchaeota archaeon]
MNSKVIAAVAIALSLIVVGWMLFRPKDGASPSDENGEEDSPPNFPNFDPDNPPERPANMTGGFMGGVRVHNGAREWQRLRRGDL